MNRPADADSLPLTGMKVLDLTRNVAGPYASLILADLGADVVKIEALHGDDCRGWGPPFIGEDSLTFMALNRNKRSVALDLREASSHATMDALVSESDVVLSSFRTGALDTLGYGWEWAQKLNPKIIYASITAFGDRGPLKDEPGYDTLIQAYAGLMSVTGEDGRPPVRVGVSIIDQTTGMWAAMAVLAALYERETTGQGRKIDTSLYETGIGWMATAIANYSQDGVNPTRCGSGAASIVPYQAFMTRDGYLVIAAGNNQLFAKLAGVLMQKQWVTDPRFASNGHRVEARKALAELIEEETQKYTRQELMGLLRAVGVPCSELREVADLHSDPQAAALELFTDLDGYEVPPRLVSLPMSFDGRRLPIRLRPPSLGEHTAEVVRENLRSRGLKSPTEWSQQ